MTDKGAEIVKTQEEAARQGLYLPQMEHDACGIGAVVSIEGLKTRSTVDQALKIVEKLEHRAGKDADGSWASTCPPSGITAWECCFCPPTI